MTFGSHSVTVAVDIYKEMRCQKIVAYVIYTVTTRKVMTGSSVLF